jgi:uncharacterized membrane protein
MDTHRDTRGRTQGASQQLEQSRNRSPARTNGDGNGSSGAHKMAKGLGWFSIGLGLAELLVPRDVARLIGAKSSARTHTTLRALGVREIISGVGILTRPENANWLWSRLGGDVMDVALLRTELAPERSESARGWAATALVLGVAAVDGLTALELERESDVSEGPSKHPMIVNATLTINRPQADVYRFWRDFQNLPGLLSHVESVRVDGNRSHWRAELPAGLELEWSAEIEEDRPDELISWRSLPGGLLQNHGRVSFRRAPGDQGTEVHVTLGFEPLGGALGGAFAKLFGSLPANKLRADLKRIKQVLETGSLMRSDASVHRGPHPARPAAKLSGRNDNGESR